MIPIGTTIEAEAVFSGTATSITAAAYVNGSGTADSVTVTLGSTRVQGGQTIQPFTWATSGLSNGNRVKIVVSGTVSAAAESYGYSWAVCTPITTPPTVVQTRQEMDANSTKLSNLDATISSRNATTPLTAQQTADAMKLAPTGGTPAIGSAMDALSELQQSVDENYTMSSNAYDESQGANYLAGEIANRLPADSALIASAASVWASSSRSLTTFGTLVADVATAVWGATIRTITGGSATSQEVSDGTAAILAAVGNLGSGNIAQPIHVQDDNGIALQGVWVSLIAGADNLGGSTDSSGNITFACHALTYAVTISLTGYQLAPTTLIASTNTATFGMTATNWPIAPTGQITVGCIMHGPDGQTVAGAILYVKCTSLTVGFVGDTLASTASGIDGRTNVSAPDLATLAFAASRDNKRWVPFSGADAVNGVIDLTDKIGH